METKVLGQSNTLLRLEIEDGNHEVLHLLVDKILEDKDVTMAAYKKDHHLFEKYSLIVKTNKKNPKTIINSAIKELNTEISTFKKTLLAKIK